MERGRVCLVLAVSANPASDDAQRSMRRSCQSCLKVAPRTFVDCAYQLRTVSSLVAGYMNAQCAKSIDLTLTNVLLYQKAYFVNVV